MSKVNIIVEDTPDGRIELASDYKPTIGSPATPAQAAALDILNRTRLAYGLPNPIQKDRRVELITTRDSAGASFPTT